MSPNVALIGLALGLSVVGLACSSNDTSSGTSLGNDGGAEGGTGTTATVKQTGQIVKYLPCQTTYDPVAGATVTVGTHTTTSDATGNYSLDIEKDTPFVMKVTNTAFVNLSEGETKISADYDRGQTRLIPDSVGDILRPALPDYDASGAIITLEVIKQGACTTLKGATITIDPPDPAAKIQYPSACISPTGDAMTDDVFPSAVIYNLTPGVSHTISITSPTCTMAPYPFAYQGLTWDGSVNTETGDAISFVRVFLTQ